MAHSKTNGKRENALNQQPSNPEDEGPACQACRKKKAKCSREQPCSQCVKFKVDCFYDEHKLKPGLKPGAVEHLSQRIETLENMFLGQGVMWQQIWESLNKSSDAPNTNPEACGVPPAFGSGVLDRTSNVRETFNQLATDKCTNEPLTCEDGSYVRQPKRRRTEEVHPKQDGDWQADIPALEVSEVDLPPDGIVANLVEFYFANMHPWIPVLHVRKFRQQIQTPAGRERTAQILHAIVAVCARFSEDPRLGNNDTKARLAKRSRQRVILCSMESFCVTNLQALVIIAFDTIGSGRGPSSWSVVGSMTRTVEQLQLSFEDEDDSHNNKAGENLIRRMTFLKPPESWSESEERRRVFWTVFLMDRFCSVSTGWNISLTSADVKQRLPCEGALWEAEQAVKTPYFGISDKGTTANQAIIEDAGSVFKPEEEQNSIGGFAYCIEATESLSLVTNFFLQRAVDVGKPQEIQMWLMKFKELDLRLIQWKLFLPAQWKEASVLNADGIMDPNLTLAHMTHNTAVILLHQGIAYPPKYWESCAVRLPSSSSAETCIEAASEISKIAQQFLLCSPILTNPQFSFCLFIAGRMLLTHTAYNKTAIPEEFEKLISTLLQISERWAGPQSAASRSKGNLASGFAKRLIHARDNLSPDDWRHLDLDIRQPAYSEQESAQTLDSDHSKGIGEEARNTQGCYEANFPNTFAGHQDTHDRSPDSVTLAFPPLPLAFQQPLQAFYQPQHLSSLHIPNTAASSSSSNTVHQSGIGPRPTSGDTQPHSFPAPPTEGSHHDAPSYPTQPLHSTNENHESAPGDAASAAAFFTRPGIQPQGPNFGDLDRLFDDPFVSIQRISRYACAPAAIDYPGGSMSEPR